MAELSAKLKYRRPPTCMRTMYSAMLQILGSCQSGAKASGATSIVEGLEMVHRQLLSALAKHGIEPIEAVGQPFDPHQHEAE